MKWWRKRRVSVGFLIIKIKFETFGNSTVRFSKSFVPLDLFVFAARMEWIPVLLNEFSKWFFVSSFLRHLLLICFAAMQFTQKRKQSVLLFLCILIQVKHKSAKIPRKAGRQTGHSDYTLFASLNFHCLARTPSEIGNNFLFQKFIMHSSSFYWIGC